MTGRHYRYGVCDALIVLLNGFSMLAVGNGVFAVAVMGIAVCGDPR